MHKTCFNCIHFHSCLSEAAPSQAHIHNYCDKFNTAFYEKFESETNRFLENYWDDVAKAAPEYPGIYSDFETGEAHCWMFCQKDKKEWPDEKFEEHKKSNRKIAIKTLEYLIAEREAFVEEKQSQSETEKFLDEFELQYFKDLLNQLRKEENL